MASPLDQQAHARSKHITCINNFETNCFLLCNAASPKKKEIKLTINGLDSSEKQSRQQNNNDRRFLYIAKRAPRSTSLNFRPAPVPENFILQLSLKHNNSSTVIKNDRYLKRIQIITLIKYTLCLTVKTKLSFIGGSC